MKTDRRLTWSSVCRLEYLSDLNQRRHHVTVTRGIKVLREHLESSRLSQPAQILFIFLIMSRTIQQTNQIKSNHFYCHITTAQVPWWVKFLWACSRQCRKTTDNLHMDRQCKKKTDNLHMDRQCKKKNRQFTYGQTVQKKKKKIYIWTDSAKNCTGAFTVLQTVQKNNNSNLHMDRQCKKTTTAIYIWTDSAKKQQQFTYGQYIFTDCTEDNVQNTHTYTQYT